MEIGLLITAVLITIVALVLKKHRNGLREREQCLQRLGFQKVPAIDQNLRLPVEQLLRRRTEKVKFGETFRMHRGSFALYRANIETGDSDSGQEWRSFVHDDRLNLPRLTIMPNVALPKLLRKMWDLLISKLTKDVGLVRVEQTGSERFDRLYLLLTRPESVADLPPADFWNRYAALPEYLSIEAAGGLIFFGRNPVAGQMGRPPQLSEDEQLREAIDLASRLHDLFARRLAVH